MKASELENVFIANKDIAWESVAEGVKRKIMAWDEHLMLVLVAFETGGIGTLHHHYHSQISYVISGVFEVEIDGEKKKLATGDVFYIPPDVVHGAVCLEAGKLIDVFSPMREDFVGTQKQR